MPRPELPPTLGEKADPERLQTFLQWVFRHDTPYRLDIRRDLNRARLYRIGRMWLEPAQRSDPMDTADWQILKQPDVNGIPMPVQNELFPVVTREAALLVKVGSRPYVRPDNDDPKTRQAADVARDVLLSKLDERDISWEDQQRLGAMNMATYGAWWQASYWDIDYTKTERMPVATGLACTACDFKLASPELDEELALANPKGVVVGEVESTNPLLDPAESYTLTTCPGCGKPLVPFTPTMEDANKASDSFGRSLGEDIPLGDVGMEVISPFDAYPNPSSQGIDTTPTNWEEFGWETPRSLDWIRARYKNGDKVKAENASDLFQYHPVVGGLGGLAYGPGPNLFENHALWRCFVKRPYMEKTKGVWKRNLGRLVIMANRIVLEDRDLMIESENRPGYLIPRMDFDWAAWELRDREARGIGMVEIAWSQQDCINTTKSQVIDARHRHGSPRWLIEQGVDMSYVGGAASGYSSDYLYFTRTDPENQGAPVPFGNTLFNSQVWQEFERDIQSLQRSLMTQEIEGGAPPGQVTAYSALLLLAQKAAEGRSPRVERLRDMKKRRYTHLLDLIHELYREDRYYSVRDKNDKWAVKSFRGSDLMGQTTVLIEDEPILDIGIVKRETLMQGLQVGSISLATAADKMRFNRAMEIPLDVQEGPNQQVAMAQKESQQWLEANMEPVIDKDGDDSLIHWQVHKEDLGRQEWADLKDLCQWRRILLLTWDWKDRLKELQAAEAQFAAQPPTPPGPEMAQLDPQAYRMALQNYEAQAQIAAGLQQLPKAIELRILHIWTQLLAQAGFDPRKEAPPGAEERDVEHAMTVVMRFEAHAAGHYWITQEQAMAATAGAAIPSAPGGVQNAEGMLPSPGEKVTPPPGAGTETLPTPGS